MKVAIVGSRKLLINNFEDYLPQETTEIVSGGAIGIDRCARKYAMDNNIKLTEFLPDYDSHYRAAPLRRNDLIIDYADIVLVFWDGKSRGSGYVITQCKKKNKPVKVFTFPQNA